MVALNWEYERESGWHTKAIPLEDDAFVFVYKTVAGDYAVSAMREGDIAGGDVEFEPSLAKAKRLAEGLISSGAYVDMFL